MGSRFRLFLVNNSAQGDARILYLYNELFRKVCLQNRELYDPFFQSLEGALMFRSPKKFYIFFLNASGGWQCQQDGVCIYENTVNRAMPLASFGG